MKLLTQMFTTLRNGQTSRKQIVQISYSNLCWNILTVLLLHGYIEGIQRKKQKILVILKYVGDQPAIKTLKQISSSTQRVYSPFNKLKSPQQGLGLLVMSTSKGIMSSSKALDLKVGGEVLCKVF
jgi:small subunit ribosomal protein S8